ncbi:MAG: pantetheine-phosphate adenylyltransferase [Spirochaetes bacterium RBG_16_67_19]|nr:MAG: pantetheine-phosphate adenylyltransferase [Spirochaetes bacterium GWB1_66_5]OHD76180.1 MAG: pantetheine-phosphate adenylyltransferase [Spirochaetes bacterium RBG_16_67_19]
MTVIYPGSFDPPTNGHLDIMKRAAGIFDQLQVIIADNPRKTYFFGAQERLGMIREMVADWPNVQVTLWQGLVVKYAEQSGARLILRGVRALADFDYEFELSMMNRALSPKIETIFMPTDQKYFVLRSSAIKEVALFGGDFSEMVPPVVAKALRERVQARKI